MIEQENRYSKQENLSIITRAIQETADVPLGAVGIIQTAQEHFQQETVRLPQAVRKGFSG